MSSAVFTSKEYLTWARNPNPLYSSITVTEPVTIDESLQLSELPASATTFKKGITVTSPHLRTFSHIVEKQAKFNAPNLIEISSSAQFEDLTLEGDKLTTFTGLVNGNADFKNMPSLSVLGGNAQFNGDLKIDNCNLSLFTATVGGNARFSNISTPFEIKGNPNIMGHLYVSNSNLTSLHATVNDKAYLSVLPQLKSIDTESKFNSSLVIRDTSLPEFNSKVTGESKFFSNPDLKVIGPNAEFGGLILISGSQLDLVEGTYHGEAYFPHKVQFGSSTQLHSTPNKPITTKTADGEFLPTIAPAIPLTKKVDLF